MADENTNANSLAEAGAGATTTTADAGVKSGGTPKQTAADAAKGGKAEDTVDYWKGEAKKAFGERDQAKKAYLESAEGKSLAERAAKADAFEKAQKDAETKAAQERGEYQKLYESEKTEHQKTKDNFDRYEKKLETSKVRGALDAAYSAVGGIDPDVFKILSDTAIEKGDVKFVDGKVEGASELVEKYVKAKPHLFKSDAAEALKRVKAAAETADKDAARALNDRGDDGKQPLSLAEMTANSKPRAHWRTTGAKGAEK